MDKSTQKMLISEWIWHNLQGVEELSKALAESYNILKAIKDFTIRKHESFRTMQHVLNPYDFRILF
jgi:hypothetical protein